MLKPGFFLFFACLLMSRVSGQTDPEILSEKVLLRREHAAGIFAHSQGAGIEFRKGYNKDFFTKWSYEFGLLEMKSTRETRVANAIFRNTRSYFYGKLNNIYLLRGGAGKQKLLNRKPAWGGVETRYFWAGGGSVAFIKPVYLDIIHDLTFNQLYATFTLKTERYDPGKHNFENIYGRASFFKGFDEVMISPGAYARGGFSFDFASKNQVLTDVEIGVAAEFFPKALQIMALRDPERFFLTFFISAHIGKRYD